MDRWVGKVAVVTGASSGIGAALCTKLVEKGVKVVGLARRIERVEALSKDLEGKEGVLHAVKCDICNESDIKQAFEWTTENVGPVSILVNNAGLTLDTTLSDGETEKWRQVIATNVLGLSIATREAVAIMKANDIQGHIVHINSLAGHHVINFPRLNIYCASKHAVTALAETLRHEFNQEGSKIKITSVSPGAVRTAFVGNVDDPAQLEAMQDIPWLEAGDVADSVMYVLSTPPHVLIQELMIRPVGDQLL